jgi:hypothetical protein
MTSDELSKSSSARREQEDHQNDQISKDALCRVFANTQRRQILLYLSDHPKPTTTRDEVLDHLVKRSEEPHGNTQRRLATQLQHVHLPKLDDHGLLEYDPETHNIAYTADSRVENMLSAIREFSSENKN